MYQKQRRSIDNRNRSYLDDQNQQVSLNYTSSMKSNNKQGRSRFFSSNQKHEKKYQYSNNFTDIHGQTPTGNGGQFPYHISQSINAKQYMWRQESAGIKNQRRQRDNSKERLQKDIDLLKDKTLDKHDFHLTGKNQRRIGKNYYGGLGNHGYSDFSEDYMRKGQIDQNSSISNQRDTFSFACKDRPEKELFQKTYAKHINENKQNMIKNIYNKKHEGDSNIQSSFEKLNQEQILQKIGRINKLNGQINNRLQKLLSKVSINE